MGLDAMILVFWMLSFKPAFTLPSFTFIKRLFSSSLLSAIRVVSSAYLRFRGRLLGLWCMVVSCSLSSWKWCDFVKVGGGRGGWSINMRRRVAKFRISYEWEADCGHQETWLGTINVEGNQSTCLWDYLQLFPGTRVSARFSGGWVGEGWTLPLFKPPCVFECAEMPRECYKIRVCFKSLYFAN